jgi:opacity protein-like surface antigen
MKKLLLAGIALTALLAPAMAADMAVKVRPVPPPPSDWAGFYLGVHGGYGWKKDRFFSDECEFFCRGKNSVPVALNGIAHQEQHIVIDGIKPKGGVFGAHAGYNWQYGSVVTGFEIDLSFTNIKGSTTGSASASEERFVCLDICELAAVAPIIDTQTRTTTEERRVKYLGTARARLGWVPVNWLLLYGTAGLAWEQLERTTTETFTSSLFPFQNNTFSFTNIHDKFGWVAGVGGEVKLFGSNVIGRLEYLHYDFGPVAGSVSSSNSSDVVRSGHQTIDVVRVGLSYKFQNGPGYY